MLSETAIFLCVQGMIELQLMSVPGCWHYWRYFRIYLDGLIEGNEAKDVEKPVRGGEDIVGTPVRK